MNTVYNNKYDILASTIAPNPVSVRYWADLASNPNGGDLKYFDGKEWKYVNNQATTDIKGLQQEVSDLKSNKVDKVNGKVLSSNDYTTAEKNKLSGLRNYDDADVRALISNLTLELNALKERVTALETPAA